ncbi:hypothetical protein BJ742DRAFT_786893 [Cladochytrium replicatum]|nr:hypothetical protein BJ742DRAFT_786893 [Cladochytrium replicatum]
MSSGVGVVNDALSLFEDMKLRRKYSWIVYKIDDGKIVPEKYAEPGTPEASYDSFAQLFPAEEGRYGVFDLEYQTAEDGVRNKLIFIMWAPNSAKIKFRMLYASSKQALRDRLQGIHAEVQCTELSEIAFESVFENVAPKGANPVIKS